MAIAKIDELRERIRDALRSDDFQRAALGLSGAGLSAAVARLFKRRNIAATLISVAPADKASLADFGAVWKSSPAGKPETNWFSIKGAKR